jgi:hypothetical protein
VKSIVTFDGELESAHSPMSINVTLEHEIDISRGDMLVTPAQMPHVSRRFQAQVVWMHSDALEADRPYLIKHTTQQVPASVTSIVYRTDINTLARIPADKLELNEIGTVQIETRKPLFFDAYKRNRATGSFIIIDPLTNLTLGAGMIAEREKREERSRKPVLEGIEFEKSRLTPAERWERTGHRPVAIWLTARLELAYLLERELFDRGCMVHVLSDDVESHLVPDLAKMSNAAGLITICSVASDAADSRDNAREVVGPDSFVAIDPSKLPSSDHEALSYITALLEERGFIRRDDRGMDGAGI